MRNVWARFLADPTRTAAGALLFLSVFAVTAIGFVDTRAQTVTAALASAFSLFTVLANTLIAIESILILAGQAAERRTRFRGCVIVSAVVMFVVCLSIDIAMPDAGNFVSNLVIAHVVTPALVMAIWVRCPKPCRYAIQDVGYLVSAPAFWISFVLLRGYATRHYPYPWIDPNQIGLRAAAANVLSLVGVELSVAFLFIAISRRRGAAIARDWQLQRFALLPRMMAARSASCSRPR